MAQVPAKVVSRISEGLKRLQPVLESAKSRDVNESDTVTIVVDILSDIFGYNRYSEITREFVIRRTFCDLAVKVENKVCLLIEVKAVGLDLKDHHVKQVVDYAANEGIAWVSLTNGIIWQVYRLSFEQKITPEKVFEINLLSINPRKEAELEPLFLLSCEGIKKSALDEYHVSRQAMSRHTIGALICSEPTLTILRRELKRLAPDAKVSLDEIKQIIATEVLKRDIVEGDQAIEAQKKVSRMMKRQQRERDKDSEVSSGSNTKSSSTSVSVSVLGQHASEADLGNEVGDN